MKLALLLLLTLSLSACVIVVGNVRGPSGSHGSSTSIRTSSVNESLQIEAGHAHNGDISSVNGSILVGDGVRAGALSTVNGRVQLGDGITLTSLSSVNGDIQAGDSLHVNGDLTTVNGAVRLSRNSQIHGHLQTANGDLRLEATTVSGLVQTRTGTLDTGRDSQLKRGIHLLPAAAHERPRDARVVIGPGTSVEGVILFERPGTLWVHDSARIGEVRGVTPQRYSGSTPR